MSVAFWEDDPLPLPFPFDSDARDPRPLPPLPFPLPRLHEVTLVTGHDVILIVGDNVMDGSAVTVIMVGTAVGCMEGISVG